MLPVRDVLCEVMKERTWKMLAIQRMKHKLIHYTKLCKTMLLIAKGAYWWVTRTALTSEELEYTFAPSFLVRSFIKWYAYDNQVFKTQDYKKYVTDQAGDSHWSIIIGPAQYRSN